MKMDYSKIKLQFLFLVVVSIIAIISIFINVFLISERNTNNNDVNLISKEDQWILKQSKKFAIYDFIAFKEKIHLDSISRLAISNNDRDFYLSMYRRYSEVGRLSYFFAFSIQMALKNNDEYAYLNTFNILFEINQGSLYSSKINVLSMYFLSKYKEIKTRKSQIDKNIYTADTVFSYDDIANPIEYLKLLESN